MSDRSHEEWKGLYKVLRRLLSAHGIEDAYGRADFWLRDDDWGHNQQFVIVRNLDMIRPSLVKTMQTLLKEFPDWEVRIAVGAPAGSAEWPEMGLTIRRHIIIDGLQRQYFPSEFQSLQYEGSKVGTSLD